MNSGQGWLTELKMCHDWLDNNAVNMWSNTLRSHSSGIVAGGVPCGKTQPGYKSHEHSQNEHTCKPQRHRHNMDGKQFKVQPRGL